MARKKPIISPLGQWAYPGEVTIIPSSDITMKGVNYPVLGIDDLGNQQMMMPGQDYTFPGNYVTEYPQMQFGGMSKRKIDRILNENKDLNFVQRMYQPNTPSIMIPGQQRPSTHFMESADGRVYPTVVQMPDGTVQYLGDTAYDYANQTGQYIEFPNDRQARRFAKGYKKGTGVLEEFGKGGLAQWFDEKWVDVKTGKACGRSGKDKDGRPYPACRPSRRVNETTPKTTSEMSSAEKDRFKREKTSGKRIDYNHKRREDGGETGWLDEYQTGGTLPPRYTSNPRKVQLYQDSLNLYNKYQPSFDKYKNWTRLNNIQTASLQGNDLFNQYWGPNKPKGPSPYNENIIIKPVEEMMHHYLRPRSGVVGGFTHLYEKPGNNYLETKISDYLTPNPKQTYHHRATRPDGQWLPYNVGLTAAQIKNNAARKNRMWPVSVTKEDFLDLGLTGVTPDLNSVFRFKKPVQPYVYKKPEVVPDVVNTPVVEPPKPSLFVSNIDRDMYTPGGGMAREYNIGITLQDGNRKSFRTEKEFQDWKAANNLDISKAKVTEGRGYSYDYPENKKYGGWLNQYQDGGVPSDIERMDPITIKHDRGNWFTRNLHRLEKKIGLDPYNERSDDFMEQWARRINTATGGKDWYKQPNDASGAGGIGTAMMETVMAPFSAPQLASVYGATGKVQMPSEAMNIQNPVGSFLADAILDPTNLVGAGIAKNLGKGSLQNMIRNRSRGVRPDFTPNVSNQLAPPPSEIIVDPTTGQFNSHFNQDMERPYFDEWVRMMNNNASELDISNLFANPAESIDLRKLKKIAKNRSGLTKEEILKNASPKDKEVLSKMSESEFEQTVLKPTGEVVPYEPAVNLGLGFNTNTRNLNLSDVIPMDNSEYVDIFNSRLDRLNEIISRNNKSGLDYSVKGLSPSGALTFNTPAQIEKLAPDTAVLNQLRNRGFMDEAGNIDPRFQDYADRWGITGNRNIPQGESTWMLDINPGQWRGEVEDIANAEYFKAIPGLNMRNTTASVFSDALPRRGTGTYNSINEYLKELDLGRVKPGFNSQSQSSSGLWEDAIKKGKAFGYFNNPGTVYGSMRTVAPLAVGAAAASQLPEQKNGGWLDIYQDGGENLPELNSKIDIANFYKNPLSEKYGIYQDPTDKGYKYYLKSAEETNIPSKTFDFSDLNNIAKKINKKEIVSPEVIKYNSRIKDYTSDQDYLMESATKEFPIIPPSYEDVLSSIPKSETLNTIPKPKTLPNKQSVVNNTSVQNNFTFDSNYWSSPDIQAEIFNRQLKDNKWYGDFDKRGDNVLNRTDVKRNYDSEIFLQNLATPNSVVIDIGSALGNNNAQLAGVSVYELASNPKIKNKNIKVIATDIPSEVKGFEELKRRGNKVYPIDYAQVPETFNTPVRDILKSKNLENVKDVYLRAANSIDLLMNVQETSEHFKHISSSLKDKNVTYLYNNVILYKPAGSTKFKKLGNLNNSAFDHRAPTWKNNPNRNHYTLLPTNATGGQTGWLNKYK